MRLEATACTHVGRRVQNEDALLSDSKLGVFAVADGMGGREGGEVASKLAIGAIADVFKRIESDPGMTWPLGIDTSLSFEQGLVDLAVRRANQAITVHRTGVLSEMGSTLALLHFREGMAVLAHVGDSRIYRLRDGQLTQLTRDHSLYDELKAAGAPDLPPRSRFPYANIITRCLGDPEKSHPSLRTEPVRRGDVFLLCSDGLIEALDDQRIAEVLALLPLEDAGPRLVREAFMRGGQDNITVVLVEVVDSRLADFPDGRRHPYVAAAHYA